MGHGASTNVKKLTISQGSRDSPRKFNDNGGAGGERAPSPAKLGWTRSSSDGCIVENLNTSKTKAELLEQQVDEFKELLHHADVKAEEAQAKAVMLEQQMAEVEGANFELLDRVSELEQQLEESNAQASPEAEREFTQMLLEKDQIVEKQEQQIKSLEEDLAKMRIKLKKRLRAAQTELAETKQEAGLKVYSLKDQLTELQEENAKLMERLDRAHLVSSGRSRQCSAVSTTPNASITKDTPTAADGEWEDSRTKVILELSSQLSTQEQKISDLEETVQEREQTIQGLQMQLKARPRPPSGSQKRHSATLRSQSAEKRSELSTGNSSKELTASDDDVSQRPSVRWQRTSSSSKRRDAHRSSSRGRDSSQEQRPSNSLTNDSDSQHEIKSIGSGKLRQQSAKSVDSAISDRSDSGSAKASSAGSSRERRRFRNQLFRQSSADERVPRTETTVLSETTRDRDSGIGIMSDTKSKDSDLEHMMEDILAYS